MPDLQQENCKLSRMGLLAFAVNRLQCNSQRVFQNLTDLAFRATRSSHQFQINNHFARYILSHKGRALIAVALVPAV
jgi:hypothetical protein